MAYSLDKIDTQILEILQKDSDQTTKRIAEQLSMTTSPVFERIKKLEKEGYIKKYVAVLDNKKIGLKLTVFIGITLQGHTRSYLEKFVKEINNFPEIVECHRVSGNFDYLSHFNVTFKIESELFKITFSSGTFIFSILNAKVFV